MRLLYLIIDGLPTFRPDIAILWGKALPRHGITADIVTLQHGEPPAGEPLWPAGQALTQPRRGNALLNGLADVLHDTRRLLAARGQGHAAIQLRDKTFIGLVCLAIARWRKIPFFYWMSFPYGPSLLKLSRSYAVRRNLPRRFYLWWRGAVGDWLLHKVILPRADHVFVQSERMREDLQRGGIPFERMTPVPMGIDPDRFPAILPRAELEGIPPGARVVGYLGECSQARRPDFLIEAVALARQSDPSIFLLIVGDAILPEEQAMLRDLLRRHGLEGHALVTGWVSPEVATATISAAQVCIALMAPDPILDSTSPTKLIEYLAMGRPVLANTHPDQAQVIAASGAGVVAPFEVAPFAQALCTLLAQPERHAAMAQAGRDYALQHRSYPRLAEALATRYRQLLVPSDETATS